MLMLTLLPYRMAPNFHEKMFREFLHIMKMLASKILVLYRCSLASYRIFQGSVEELLTSPMDNFPVAASSI